MFQSSRIEMPVGDDFERIQHGLILEDYIEIMAGCFPYDFANKCFYSTLIMLSNLENTKIGWKYCSQTNMEMDLLALRLYSKILLIWDMDGKFFHI